MSDQAQAETLSFQTEAKQILHLMAHALYSNREIFLRELISNASDAADKLRFEALSDDALYGDDHELKIWVDVDAKASTITVRDNGVGMSREEVIQNLGTIAKSGTKEFLSKLSGDQAKDASLIGQFGVGFYSAFVVADKVTVKTRRAGMQPDQGVWWESDGQGEYRIKNMSKDTRGTEVVLHLKKSEKEFLEGMRLRNVITKYSDHIVLPIVMQKEPEGGEDDKKSKAKPEEEVVNRATALWTLPKNKIKDEEYKELYKHVSHDFSDPLMWAHNKVEGKLEYTSLLYIPTQAPFDLWNRDHRRGLKLYVKRIFIMDDAENLLPMYLRFVKGVVDSNDLPLNISREILQSNKTIDSIKSGCVRRVLEMLEKISKNDPEKYKTFWEAFGNVLKEGPAEDFANRERAAKLLRFASTHNDTPEQTVTIEDYISRMQKGQDKIYFVTAETFNAAKNSPHLEIFRKKGLETLLLYDRVDEWLMSNLVEFEGKQFQSVAKGELDFGELEGKEGEKDKKEQEKTEKKHEEEFASVIEQMKKLLGDKVEAVRLTDRLTDSPACLVGGEHDMSIHLQQLLKEVGQSMPAAKPTLEINPEHPIISRLKSETDDEQFSEWSHILFDQAYLAEGGRLEDPAGYVKRLNGLLLQLAK